MLMQRIPVSPTVVVTGMRTPAILSQAFVYVQADKTWGVEDEARVTWAAVSSRRVDALLAAASIVYQALIDVCRIDKA